VQVLDAAPDGVDLLQVRGTPTGTDTTDSVGKVHGALTEWRCYEALETPDELMKPLIQFH
jgi:hypothetical protein